MLKIIETCAKPAQDIMDKDRMLLEELDPKASPILHLYEWKGKSVTCGMFIDIEKNFDISNCEEEKINIGRRPTGGGVIFHIWDYAFSFLMPSSNEKFDQSPLKNYQFVNRIVQKACLKFLDASDQFHMIDYDVPTSDVDSMRFCMARPTKYDLLIGDKKLVGAAQRKKKNGYLHQGSIALQIPDVTLLAKVLKVPNSVLQNMIRYSYPLVSQKIDEEQMKQIRFELKKCLIEAFRNELNR
ncbi:MAG TPA: hypothetical protein P5048_02665 [Chlamydiales bacterium]|nr:hypothetical protein [Chlamydiales bacterium]